MDLSQKILVGVLAAFLLIALIRVFQAPLRLALKLLVALLGHVFFFFSIAFSQMQGPKAVLCLSVLALCALGNILPALRELRRCRRESRQQRP